MNRMEPSAFAGDLSVVDGSDLETDNSLSSERDEHARDALVRVASTSVSAVVCADRVRSTRRLGDGTVHDRK